VKERFILILLCFGLQACTTEPDKGVVDFIEEIKKQTPGYIENVPVILQPEGLKYGAEKFRDPFEANSVLKVASEEAKNRLLGGPDLDRPREPLESFPLENLRMVGTLEKEGKFYALIQDSMNTVHLVNIGNYVGENSGQIEKISEAEIDVKEWLPDGKGGWQAHSVIIPFAKNTPQTKGQAHG